MALPLHFRSATELARLLRARKVTASALLEDCLAQYKAHNKALNAVVVTDIPRAKKAAAAADRRLRAGKPKGPFDGVPMTAKESFDMAGLPSTWGDPRFKDNMHQPMRWPCTASKQRVRWSMARPTCR